MRSKLIIVFAPWLDFNSCIFKGKKPVCLQVFFTKTAIEWFNMGRKKLTRNHIHDNKGSEPGTVEQQLWDEIHCPELVSPTQDCLIIMMWFVRVGHSVERYKLADIPYAYLVGCDQFVHLFILPGMSHAFFDSTSCRMCLSRLKSTTICFKSLFSSSRWVQAFEIARHEPCIFLFPSVEGLSAYFQFANDLCNRCSWIRLFQGKSDLLWSKAWFFHRTTSSCSIAWNMITDSMSVQLLGQIRLKPEIYQRLRQCYNIIYICDIKLWYFYGGLAVEGCGGEKSYALMSGY